MDKKYITYILISMILLLGIFNKLNKDYETFIFQTYRTIPMQEVYSGSIEEISIDALYLCENKDYYTLSNGIISGNYHDVKVGCDNQEYEVQVINGVMQPVNINSKDFSLYCDDKLVDLSQQEVKVLNSKYDYYALEDVVVSHNNMSIGYFFTQNKELIQKYPTLSIELSYKEQGQDQIFYVEKMNTIDYVNNHYTKVIHGPVNLDDKDLKIVFVFEGDSLYVFEMELK